VRAADATSSPTPTVASDTGERDPLAGFPLAVGLPDTNEDDSSPVVVTDRPATKAFDLCGTTAWNPHRDSSGVIGVTFSGEAEWYRGRTLVLYPSADAAAAAVDAAHRAVAGCGQDPECDSGHTAHTVVDYEAGDRSFAWMDRYWSPDLDGFDTGLTVYHVVGVGRAVLLTYEYGEGNGSEQTRQQAIDRAAEDDEEVVAAMAALPSGAGEGVTLTPAGAGPFRLGMDVAQARAAGGRIGQHGGATACPELTWTDPSGATVHGTFSPGIGLGEISVEGGRTEAGIGLGSTVAELRAAYPHLRHTDNGLSYVDGEPGDLAFATYRGAVNWMATLGADQQCTG
jgi:hypothetical protein